MANDWRWCWTPKRLKVLPLPCHLTCHTIKKLVYYQHLLLSFEELLSQRLSDPFALVVGWTITDYLIVTIICGCYILPIFAIWKNSHPQKFLQTYQGWPTYQVFRCTCIAITNSGMGCHISTCFTILFIVSAFSFLSSRFPLHGNELKKVTSDGDYGRLRSMSETCSYRQRLPLRLHDAACYMYSKFNENYTAVAATLV